MPMLCVAGLIEHPCAAEICHPYETEHDSHSDEDQDSDGDCGHESDCAADPCQRDFVRFARFDDVDSGEWAPLAIGQISVELRSSTNVSSLTFYRSDNAEAPSPLLPGDLPLLI
jgi:hypothetical protein